MSDPSVADTGLRKRSTRRRLTIAASVLLLLLLAILLPPYINIGRYRRSIAGIVSRSLGRPVHIGSVQLRLLPVPGIEMSDFEVEEDPAFGSEPALRASSVVATLRLSSLWRGRLEVSRIGLEDASLNLVRNSEGRWSIGSVLNQASHLSNAPTAQRRAGNNPRFPYIEATDARINFKEGLEKKPFSLMNAEFSMWLDTPSDWRVRLKAQPARTDINPGLSDAGELTVEGSMHRAADIDVMPVHLNAEWSGAQLGQVSRLLTASDSGWRGDLDITAALTGQISQMHVRSQIKIRNAHRLEFEPATPVDVDASCEGNSLPAAHAIENLVCFLPVGAGHLLLTGDLRSLDLASAPVSSLKLEINHAPASLAVDLLGLMRQRAGNVTATGTVSGEFQYRKDRTETLTGQATVIGASLLYPGLDQPLQLPPLHFLTSPAVSGVRRPRAKHIQPSLPPPVSITLQSVPVPLGADAPLNITGTFSRTGFLLHFSGQAALDRLLRVSSGFGPVHTSLAVISPQSSAAKAGSTVTAAVGLDLSIQAPWLVPVADQNRPERAATTLGSVQIKNVQIKADFLSEPLEISSASLSLAPGAVSWNNIAASFHHIPVHGSAGYPENCISSGPCPIEFSLDTGAVDTATLQSAIMGAGDHGELLDAILARMTGQHRSWPPLQGTVHIGTLQLGELPLRNVTASIAIAGTDMHIASLDASALGGTLHAAGSMDVSASQPAWKLSLRFARIAAADLSALFHERWGAGTLNADAQLTAQGFREDALLSSAEGNFHFDWKNGTLPAVAPPSGLPLPHFDRWTGEGTISKSAFELMRSRISHGSQSSTVSGTISFQRNLALQATAADGSFHLAGSPATLVLTPSSRQAPK